MRQQVNNAAKLTSYWPAAGVRWWATRRIWLQQAVCRARESILWMPWCDFRFNQHWQQHREGSWEPYVRLWLKVVRRTGNSIRCRSRRRTPYTVAFCQRCGATLRLAGLLNVCAWMRAQLFEPRFNYLVSCSFVEEGHSLGILQAQHESAEAVYGSSSSSSSSSLQHYHDPGLL